MDFYKEPVRGVSQKPKEVPFARFRGKIAGIMGKCHEWMQTADDQSRALKSYHRAIDFYKHIDRLKAAKYCEKAGDLSADVYPHLAISDYLTGAKMLESKGKSWAPWLYQKAARLKMKVADKIAAYLLKSPSWMGIQKERIFECTSYYRDAQKLYAHAASLLPVYDSWRINRLTANAEEAEKARSDFLGAILKHASGKGSRMEVIFDSAASKHVGSAEKNQIKER